MQVSTQLTIDLPPDLIKEANITEDAAFEICFDGSTIQLNILTEKESGTLCGQPVPNEPPMAGCTGCPYFQAAREQAGY